NMVLVVAGNVNVEKIKEMEATYFGGLSAFETEKYKEVKPDQKNPIVMLKHKKTEQTHFALGVRTVSLTDEKERIPLSVLASLLGGGMSSRLFHEIRERRGLSYYVRTLSENFLDSGYLATFAGVDPKRIDEEINVVVAEYEKLSKIPDITENELTKAKEFTKGHFILEMEDTKSVAAFYAVAQLLEKKLETPEELIKKIDNVKLEDVLVVARKYLGAKSLSLAIIGDFRDEDHFKKLLI
ncbi:insulinase family protein, partial [Patescibacteria group bacterium]|nr:insulinase family protein [Patescibacteria group bacterium]